MQTRRLVAALGWGASIGALGGLVGLGGAEFRLPVLLGVFRFRPLDAVILNKALSLIVVAAALVFRTRSVPLSVLTIICRISVAARGNRPASILAPPTRRA